MTPSWKLGPGKTLRWALLVPGLVLAYVFLAPLPLRLLGYYPDGVGGEVAAEIVARGGEASDCLKIIHLVAQPFSPTQGEQRASCVYDYARLTHDPSACERLMPSRYGLDCVGAALSERRPCPLGRERTVSLSGGFRASLAECINGPENIRSDACCTVAKARFLTTFNDCSSVAGQPELADQCHHMLAFKNHDPASCDSIQNPTLKSACIIQARALRNDPTICQGCTPPVESVEDLR